MRRRELLAGIAGVAGAATIGQTQDAAPRDPTAGFEQLLYGRVTAEPLPLAALRSATRRARNAFQAARYQTLSAELPALIAAAIATEEQSHGDDRPYAAALLADAYAVGCDLLVKRNDDILAWAIADRACQAADRGEDSLTLAAARRRPPPPAAASPPCSAAQVEPPPRRTC